MNRTEHEHYNRHSSWIRIITWQVSLTGTIQDIWREGIPDIYHEQEHYYRHTSWTRTKLDLYHEQELYYDVYQWTGKLNKTQKTKKNIWSNFTNKRRYRLVHIYDPWS